MKYDIVIIGAGQGNSNDCLFQKEIMIEGCVSLLVEPVPHLFEKLKKLYESNPNVHIENSAIDLEPRTKTIFTIKEEYLKTYVNGHNQPFDFRGISSFNQEHLLSHHVSEDHIEAIEVNCLDFTDLIRKYSISEIDFLHIDCEGYEDKVLYGLLSATLSGGIPLLLPDIIELEHCYLKSNDLVLLLFKKLKYEQVAINSTRMMWRKTKN